MRLILFILPLSLALGESHGIESSSLSPSPSDRISETRKQAEKALSEKDVFAQEDLVNKTDELLEDKTLSPQDRQVMEELRSRMMEQLEVMRLRKGPGDSDFGSTRDSLDAALVGRPQGRTSVAALVPPSGAAVANPEAFSEGNAGASSGFRFPTGSSSTGSAGGAAGSSNWDDSIFNVGKREAPQDDGRSMEPSRPPFKELAGPIFPEREMAPAFAPKITSAPPQGWLDAIDQRWENKSAAPPSTFSPLTQDFENKGSVALAAYKAPRLTEDDEAIFNLGERKPESGEDTRGMTNVSPGGSSSLGAFKSELMTRRAIQK